MLFKNVDLNIDFESFFNFQAGWKEAKIVNENMISLTEISKNPRILLNPHSHLHQQ